VTVADANVSNRSDNVQLTASSANIQVQRLIVAMNVASHIGLAPAGNSRM
jgi:hypothetical protein